jgi:hypothetical protein
MILMPEATVREFVESVLPKFTNEYGHVLRGRTGDRNQSWSGKKGLMALAEIIRCWSMRLNDPR